MASCLAGSTSSTARSLYEAFPVYPAAVERDAERYEITHDGRSTGDYGLQVMYALPAAAAAGDVLDFYREHLPDGWGVASDEMCQALLRQFPEPPRAPQPTPSTTGPTSTDDFKLLQTRSRLTTFTPGGSPVSGGDVDGVSFTLMRDGDVKYVVADAPVFGCGSEDTDVVAADFDR